MVSIAVRHHFFRPTTLAGTASGFIESKYAFFGICGLLPLMVAGAGITLQSPWNDELYTLAIATSGGPCQAAWWSFQAHTLPAYPFISWFFSLAGMSLVGARLLSVLAFAAASLCFCRLVWLHFGQRVALVCGVAMAFHPLAIWHAQDARMYALGLLCECGALLALDAVLERGRFRDYAALAGLVALGTLNHMYYLFVVALLALWALSDPNRERVWRAAFVVVLVAGLAFTPSLYLILFEESYAGFERPASLMALIYVAMTFSAGYSVGATREELHLPNALGAMLPHLPYVIPLMLAFWTVVLAGAVRLYQYDRRWAFRIVLGPAILILLPFIVSALFGRVSYNVRYVLVALPFVLLIAAYGLCSARLKARWILAGLLVTAEGVGLVRHYTEDAYFNEDYRSVAQWLAATMRDGDTVYRTPNNFLAYVIDPKVYRQVPAVRPETIGETLKKEGRKIYVIDRPWHYDPRGTIRDTLREQKEVEHIRFRGLDVFVVPGGDTPADSE